MGPDEKTPLGRKGVGCQRIFHLISAAGFAFQRVAGYAGPRGYGDTGPVNPAAGWAWPKVR